MNGTPGLLPRASGSAASCFAGGRQRAAGPRRGRGDPKSFSTLQAQVGRDAAGTQAARRARCQAAAAVLSLSSGLPEEEQPLRDRLQWPVGGGPLQQPQQQQQQQLDLERERGREKKPRLVRVRLSVHYRVHSRQMLCIGGSQMPFGWSFLSIAKVPMTWTAGDVWRAEVLLPAGQRVEYKYVILEEQDWTKLENEDAEGLVEVTYRSGSEPGEPPDVTVIQKQMAIVAWQPGPNRIVQVPTEEEITAAEPGVAVERVPARAPRPAFEPPSQPDPFAGTSETFTRMPEGEPFLDRQDVWGWSPSKGESTRPPNMRGLRFDN